MASSRGQKVTTDPETFNNPKDENPGIVTSDSLAAESIREGGSFAANADSRGPMDQPSYSVNTATTDVSNATVLEPAPDAEARLVSQEWDEAAALNTALGRKDVGAGPTWNTPSGGTGVVDQTTREELYGTGNAAPAPGYAAHPAPAMGQTGTFQPKGKNLTEGGFDPDLPNASGTTDIGGKKDPGRVGLTTAELENTPFAGAAGAREAELTNETRYDALDSETSS